MVTSGGQSSSSNAPDSSRPSTNGTADRQWARDHSPSADGTVDEGSNDGNGDDTRRPAPLDRVDDDDGGDGSSSSSNNNSISSGSRMVNRVHRQQQQQTEEEEEEEGLEHEGDDEGANDSGTEPHHHHHHHHSEQRRMRKLRWRQTPTRRGGGGRLSRPSVPQTSPAGTGSSDTARPDRPSSNNDDDEDEDEDDEMEVEYAVLLPDSFAILDCCLDRKGAP
ncbi:sarcoplasmic reticulum histidine-rich calcium-binding protein-like [Anopheles aquasalis]|uniref:sarcoplasmic reticulum histidine-rich calcium-binding protein-like n=1 Tax=Anopheles aquasalis TaxID=42839 RepID=UPI00215B0235|nr:sarcoplasmic reticulum histidine-rich calcium-binding protein-like [Anopheles aquasalis]